MPLKLPPGYTDPSTGTPLPNAVADALDATVSLRAGVARIQLAIFASAAAEAAHMQPIDEVTLALTPAEIQSLVTQFTAAVLALIAQRPEYVGSTVI